MKRRTPKLSRNGNHLMIDIFEDGHVQAVTHSIGIGSNSGENPEFTTSILHPTLYDGTFRFDGELVDTESEWSLSTGTEASEESESEMNLEEVGSRPVFSVPVIEQSNDPKERNQSILVASKDQEFAVGAVIESESTVLMQLSRGEFRSHDKLMDCMKEVNEMLNSQNSVVLLKYPTMSDSQGSKRIQESHKQTTKQMMELTEDVLRRVQGTSRESILVKLQRALGEILYQPDDTIVIHTFSKEKTDTVKSEAFVGYFSTEDTSAVLVAQSIEKEPGSNSGSEDEEQMSMDQLRSFLQDFLQAQDDIMEKTLHTEPEITISNSGDCVVGVLSFPNASCAVVKTNVQNFPLDQDPTEMVQSMKDLYRNLVQESSEKLLIQTHSNGNRSYRVEHIKTELDESMKSDQLESDASGISVRESNGKIIGVLNYTGGSIVIQTTSKNWIKSHSSADPQDLVRSIRLLIEQFITNNELNDVDLRSLAAIIAQVFHCPRVDLPVDFTNKHVLQKIPFAIHQLMNPSDSEDPLFIINQIRDILEDIPKAPIVDAHSEDIDDLNLLKSYFDEMICEENSQFEGGSILRALRKALLDVLVHYEASLSSALEGLLELLKTIPAENIELHSLFSCPGLTNVTDEHLQLESHPSDAAFPEVVQHIHNLLGEEEPPEGHEVSYITMFQTLFLSLIKIIGGWSFRIKSFLDKEPQPVVRAEPKLESDPIPGPSSSLTRKPSVSFHLIHAADSNEDSESDISQQLEEERQTLNNTIDELRLFLEKSLNVPHSQERKVSRMELLERSPGLKQRMVLLFCQLLDEAQKLREADKSTVSIHLQLDSATGDLEHKEGEQYVVLNGNIRDWKHNLGLFFEARMIDLRYESKLESEVECVKEVRRLSDESDEFVLGDLVPEMVESCMAEVGSELGDVNDVNARTSDGEFRLQETLSRYFDLIQNYIQESMDPMRETMGLVLERLAAVGAEKDQGIGSSSNQSSRNLKENYIVEMIEDERQDESFLGEVEEVMQAVKSVQCVASVANQSVQHNDDLKSETTRLDGIENELKEMKQQLKDLCDILRLNVKPMEQPCVGLVTGFQSVNSESSQTNSSLMIVEPSAPTLEEIESCLSVTVNIISDTDESKSSKVSDVHEEVPSATESPDKSECVDIPSDVAGKSSISSSLRSTVGPIQDSEDELSPKISVDVETSNEPVDEQRQLDFSPGSDVRRDTRTLSFKDSAVKNIEEQLLTSSEQTVNQKTRRSSTVDPSETVETVEEELPHTRLSENTMSQSHLDEHRESTVDPYPIAHIAEPLEKVSSTENLDIQPIESERPSSSDSEKLQTDNSRRTTIGSTGTSNEQRVSEILTSKDSSETLRSSTISQQQQQRLSSFVQTSPQESWSEAEQSHRPTDASIICRGSTAKKQRKLSRKLCHDLDEISVPDGHKSKRRELCDLALSYQCSFADEIGMQFICPAEIYSCHPVGPNQLMIHWEVAPQFLKQINGFKIYVDGEERSVCYSGRRRTALIEDINLGNHHRLAIYCTPEASIRELVRWVPGIFFYHL